MLGLQASSVNTYAMLLELDDDSQTAVEEGELTATDAREAVRAARARRRSSAGRLARGRPVVAEPAYLNSSHPLAERVKASCDHSSRPLVGQVGCGQCWESAIATAALEQSRRHLAVVV